MKKTIVILLITSFGVLFQAHAQNKFSINGYCSPDYTYTFAKANDNVGEFILADRDTSMSGSFGLHSGISFDYHLSDKISIGIGINYSKYQFKSTWFDAIAIYNNQFILTRKKKVDDVYEFIHIPIQLKYYFNEDKIRFYAHTGLSFQYLLSYMSNYTLELYDGSTKKYKSNSLANSDCNRFNMVLHGGFGIAYHFNENLAIYTEPHFRYSLLSLVRDKDNSLTEHFYSIGLQTGITWHF